MSLKDFENEYWQHHKQSIVFRHKAAIDLVEKGPILDLGCGDGLFLEILKEKGIKGVGFDISEIAVNKAKNKGLDVRNLDFATNRLPFKDDYFETVTLLDVLEHLYQPNRVLKEVYRITKSFLILGTPNFNSFPARLQTLIGRIPENNTPKNGHIYWISWSVINNLLRNSGFRIEAIRVNSFFSWAPGLRNILQFLAETRPSLFALNFVIKARKSINYVHY